MTTHGYRSPAGHAPATPTAPPARTIHWQHHVFPVQPHEQPRLRWRYETSLGRVYVYPPDAHHRSVASFLLRSNDADGYDTST